MLEGGAGPPPLTTPTPPLFIVMSQVPPLSILFVGALGSTKSETCNMILRGG
jgi:hypothetical protein